MFFPKKRYILCTIGSGANPTEAGEFAGICVLKLTLQSISIRLLELQKNWGTVFLIHDLLFLPISTIIESRVS